MRWIVVPLLLSSLSSAAHAERYFVKTQAEYAAATKLLKAGDVVVLANGQWRDFEIDFAGHGLPGRPITLTVEEPGKVVISGRSNLKIGGSNLLVSGLVFRDGSTPTGEVISFRRSRDDVTSDSRVTSIVIENFNQPDRYQSDYWVALYGKRNRFDHSALVGKTNQGVTLAVRLDTTGSRENSHHIDHNYFGPRPVLGSNGGESIRIGTSAYSMYVSKTFVEDNIFERCDGEVEILSVKSGGNAIRRNVFLESRGSVVLRHGDGNLVERNVFLGRGKLHSGGVRIIARNQIVRDNYLEGLRGTDFASALAVMNGVPNSPVNRYVQVDHATIKNNSILDSDSITFGAGSDLERTAAPTASSFTGNLIQLTGASKSMNLKDSIAGLTIRGNILVAPSSPIAGVVARNVALKRSDNGLLYPPAGSHAGAPRDLKVIGRDEVGPSWYAKPAAPVQFDSGPAILVSVREGMLVEGLSHLASGSCLVLAPGSYAVDRTLVIDRNVCIKSAEPGRATIRFGRAPLFEVAVGGQLRLSGIDIRGDGVADAVGNAVIRTAPAPMPANFAIELDQVDVRDLDINQAFDVIAIGKSAMAGTIRITNSNFANISGMVVAAASETDDFGRYNVEDLDVSGSHFDNMRGGIVNLYRGGSDESTFGPHFRFENNRVTSSGGKIHPALALVGVQDVTIRANYFMKSGALRITETTGSPKMTMIDNEFVQTILPSLLAAEGRTFHPLSLAGNRVDGAVQ